MRFFFFPPPLTPHAPDALIYFPIFLPRRMLCFPFISFTPTPNTPRHAPSPASHQPPHWTMPPWAVTRRTRPCRRTRLQRAAPAWPRTPPPHARDQSPAAARDRRRNEGAPNRRDHAGRRTTMLYVVGATNCRDHARRLDDADDHGLHRWSAATAISVFRLGM